MFERFTRGAREVVVGAQQQARELRAGHIGTEHLLLGVLAGQGPAATILTEAGLSAEAVHREIQRLRGPFGGSADAGALQTLGIDLDAVRETVEQTFGPGSLERASGRHPGWFAAGRIPFSPRAKKTLELSLRQAIHLHDDHISSEHIMLGLLMEGKGLAMQVITSLGVRPDDVRQRLLVALGKAA